jgi:gliding motility-associated-like protein
VTIFQNAPQNTEKVGFRRAQEMSLYCVHSPKRRIFAHGEDFLKNAFHKYLIYMRLLIVFLLFLCSGAAFSQNLPDRLTANFTFDDCDGFDDSGNGSAAALVGDPLCACGVVDSALRFDGRNDALFLVGPVNDVFSTSDFSVSFYMKPLTPAPGPGSNSTQVILAKQSICNRDNVFWVRYQPNTKVVSSLIAENDSLLITVSGKLDADPCWQLITLVRSNLQYTLYVNGQLRDSRSASKRINLNSTANLRVGEAVCPLDTNYLGYLDELQFYSKALKPEEFQLIDRRPDKIANSDTLIYLGNSFNIEISNTCATQFSWSPTAGVSDPSSPTPTITPTSTTEYSLIFEHQGECLGKDRILVKVIDPDTLDCTQIFIPNAFTPGASPGRNDRFGVSNPFAVNDFISFEIFDRWGGRMFNAASPFETWDGNFQDKPVGPGVYLYRLRFRCQGQEEFRTGSVTLLR